MKEITRSKSLDKSTENLKMKSTHYKGKHNGFSLTVKIRYLINISEKKPEFFYRVSFEENTADNEVATAVKDFRVLVKEWCDR